MEEQEVKEPTGYRREPVIYRDYDFLLRWKSNNTHFPFCFVSTPQNRVFSNMDEFFASPPQVLLRHETCLNKTFKNDMLASCHVFYIFVEVVTDFFKLINHFVLSCELDIYKLNLNASIELESFIFG